MEKEEDQRKIGIVEKTIIFIVFDVTHYSIIPIFQYSSI